MAGDGSPAGGTLVFVYNADGGLLNGLKDIWQRAADSLDDLIALVGARVSRSA